MLEKYFEFVSVVLTINKLFTKYTYHYLQLLESKEKLQLEQKFFMAVLL